MNKNEQKQVDKQTDAFIKEILKLKQRVEDLEYYIGFRDLWEDFKKNAEIAGEVDGGFRAESESPGLKDFNLIHPPLEEDFKEMSK